MVMILQVISSNLDLATHRQQRDFKPELKINYESKLCLDDARYQLTWDSKTKYSQNSQNPPVNAQGNDLYQPIH